MEGNPGMKYYLCYKEKIIGKAMSKEKADVKLSHMESCFAGLEIRKVDMKDEEIQLPIISKLKDA